jgi:hypothetical protein
VRLLAIPHFLCGLVVYPNQAPTDPPTLHAFPAPSVLSRRLIGCLDGPKPNNLFAYISLILKSQAAFMHKYIPYIIILLLCNSSCQREKKLEKCRVIYRDLQVSHKVLQEINQQTMLELKKLNQYSNTYIQKYYINALTLERIVNDFCCYIDTQNKGLRSSLFDENTEKDSLQVPKEELFSSGGGYETAIRFSICNGLMKNILDSVAMGFGKKPWTEDDLFPQIIKDPQSWAAKMFSNKNKVEKLLLLMKLKQDVLTTQANCLSLMLRSIGRDDFRFDPIIPVVKFPKHYIRQNEKVDVSIFLALYDTKVKANFIFPGEEYYDCLNRPHFIGPTNTSGYHYYKGSVGLYTHEGFVELPLVIDYMVK